MSDLYGSTCSVIRRIELKTDKMRSALVSFSEIVDRIVEYVGRSVSWLALALVILICADVLMRYLFDSSKTWIIELEWHIFAVLFLLGMSYTLLHDKHVRVDLFYERFSQRRQRIVSIVGILFLVLPWCLVVLDTSWDYFSNSFSFREGSPQPNGLPARYVIKSFIFIGFSLLTLEALSVMIKSIYGITSSSQTEE